MRHPVQGHSSKVVGAGEKPLSFWSRYRAKIFQVYLTVAVIAFIVLTVLAKSTAFFPFDLAITLAVQRYHPAWFTALMVALSWPGFAPQTYVLSALMLIFLRLKGLIWEAIVTLGDEIGTTVLGQGVKFVVERPRPSPDLVHVIQQLNSYSFPSGHVLYYTSVIGFLFFLTYVLRKPDWIRKVLLVVFGGMIALIGVSRIYEGQHWASDVLASYLIGSVCLSLTIWIYRWGKPRFFVTQSIVKETSTTR